MSTHTETSPPRRKRQRCCLPLSQWPPNHAALWQAAQKPGSKVRAGGLASEWAPPTRSNGERAYGEYLLWISEGEPGWAAIPPAELFTEERILAFVENLGHHVEPISVGMKIDKLRQIVKAMMPGDWEWLSTITANLISRAGDGRDKRNRLVHSRTLFEFGLRLTIYAEEAPDLRPVQRAVLFRDGLMIAFLACRPFRKRNVRAMVLGTTMVREGDEYWIHFPKTATKHKQAIDIYCPAPLTALFDRYFEVHRKVLVERRRGADKTPVEVWISDQGRPMGDKAIYDVVTRRTHREFERSVNPHLFRDCIATTIAIDDPVFILAAAAVLGHRTLAMVTRHYNQADMVSAVRELQDVVDDAEAGRETPRAERARIPPLPRTRQFDFGKSWR